MCFTIIIVVSAAAAHLPGVTDMGCNYLGDIECAIREIELCGLLQVCSPYLFSRAYDFYNSLLQQSTEHAAFS
jgi:hypothetical protein